MNPPGTNNGTKKKKKLPPTKTGQITRKSVKPKRKNPVVSSSKQEIAWRVPECVTHFMSAMVNPFDTEAGACLPSELFPLPSGKYKTYVRTKMNLGTSGVGFAAVTPTGANDESLLQTTTSTSVLTSAQACTAATNLNNSNCIQNPFAGAQYDAGNVLIRFVAAGLRVKYVGQLANRNGTCSAFEDPDHADARRYSYDALSSHPQSEITRVDNESWDAACCLSGPVVPDEFDFQPAHYPYGVNAPLLIMIAGVPGDLYEVEAYQHFEVIGQVVTNKSRSHSDPQALGKALEASKGVTANVPLSPKQGPALWERFVQGVQETLPRIGSFVGNRLLPGIGGLIGGLITNQSSLPPPGGMFRHAEDRSPMLLLGA